MQTHNLGYPRIGNQRELKKACEQYWAGKINHARLQETAAAIRRHNWQLQKDSGIDIIPCNDFSFYDHVLDTCLMVGAIPARYEDLNRNEKFGSTDLLFAMARGYQQNGYDLTAMEMTKWFDTNYHYIVPEFTADQHFSFSSSKVIDEFREASGLGINVKPVLLGPVSFLLLGKEKQAGFHRLELIDKLIPVYIEILQKLSENNASYVQFDEPCLCLDLTEQERYIFFKVYQKIKEGFPHLHIILAGYFECYGDNLPLLLQLPADTIHLDLVRCPSQLDDILNSGFDQSKTNLSLGVVDGRNIWINDLDQSLLMIKKATDKLGNERILIAPSCSLLHVPCDLDLEDDTSLAPDLKSWMSFAKQKLKEVVALKQLVNGETSKELDAFYNANKSAIESRRTSPMVHDAKVKEKLSAITESVCVRKSSFAERKEKQQQTLHLNLFPTTTIGSFPQTAEVRSWRAKLKKGELIQKEYDELIAKETIRAIQWQEEIGMDVLVHGEFERNDMVEYFGEQLNGFAFTKNGWVQSYGSRCVKPPVIYGDVSRRHPMTVKWSSFAQSLTKKHVKGMLTGPVTILQWSFARNDQQRRETCYQVALAIRDEVIDLENAGIRIIQIDEPAIREGLPLRKADRKQYLDWAVKAFRLASSGVKDATQIHTHMCYSEFNDIISDIAAMDADVITIECSRSQMELLDVFAAFSYPNDIGPGVYDIHSPRIPSSEEMKHLLDKALQVIPAENLWVNPDCGLKTRKWEETRPALVNMIQAAQEMRGERAKGKIRET